MKYWRGFLFLRITVLYFFVIMGVIDTYQRRYRNK